MRRTLIVCALVLAAPAAAHAGGGGVDTSGCSGYSEGTTVSMLDSCFSGVAHFAPGGTAITISNDGGLPHTMTAVDGSFDTGQIAAGDSTQLTFEETGIHRVYCALHGTPAGEGMAGLVVVGDALPPAVAVPTDTGAISAAVAEEMTPVVAAVKGQREAIQSLRLTELQARLLEALENLETAAEAPATPATEESGDIIPMMAIGLAGGLGLAALIIALRLGGVAAKPRLEPDVG